MLNRTPVNFCPPRCEYGPEHDRQVRTICRRSNMKLAVNIGICTEALASYVPIAKQMVELMLTEERAGSMYP